MNIGILTFQDGYRRGVSNDFYPIIKWKKIFIKKNIYPNFFNSHKNKKLYKQDIVIIDYRYIRTLTIHKEIYDTYKFIIGSIEKLKRQGVKVLLFDTDDGTGSEIWDLIEYSDLFLKKQLLKDQSFYTQNNGVKSYMVFVSGYNLSCERIAKNLSYKQEYSPCPEDELKKIRVGWNIGMSDYRFFPLSRYYPICTSRLANSIYEMPRFKEDLENKPIDSIFRGEIRHDNENYSFQRNKVIELFQSERYPNYITGDVISKTKYLNELKKSKTCVSPFGWGEICYRDFEAIINGCVLIKPDMEHLETWPDVYRKNETYVSIKWDMSDLEDKLNEVINNYEDYKPLVRNAQQIYKEVIKDGEGFVNRFKEIVGL